jgi:hypothetical protein
MRSASPPPFENYVPVSEQDLWQKMRDGKVEAHVYSGVAPGDFEPVPIPAAAFVIADEARTDEEYGFPTHLAPFQILWRDSDPRRSSATRRAVRVPHWVYMKKAAPQSEPAPEPKKEHCSQDKAGFLTNKQEALQADCVAWLRSLPPTPVPTKDAAKTAAKRAIEGLSGRQFDRAWHQAAPPAWKRAGPKTPRE